ncbi:helix-turn-helix domain-containing protein [Actinocorallia sp. A-T 12471]|uniref:helix-turn-helix domain-containing protein n=1 Tax=Actinocorallia sp. A-T 12471 TaxID=3089813 RepID=UPI0029CD58AA|nr:helix-turn-helix domain-containing protein [Actinocorallia sp. A-T 12471]MDX6741234.1 helix-turn-helix domain-containing protein [Actinocorallia sp. A-T 12471]
MSSTARPCSIAGALQIVGERWALLAVREIMFGNRRFDEIARNTGASRDILTARLRSLETAGILERRRYHDRPARYEYHLTEAGRDLAPVLHALRDWGDHWLPDPPPVTAHHTCGHPLDPLTVCRHCGAEATPETLRLTVNAPGWTLKGPE